MTSLLPKSGAGQLSFRAKFKQQAVQKCAVLLFGDKTGYDPAPSPPQGDALPLRHKPHELIYFITLLLKKQGESSHPSLSLRFP